MTAEVSIELSDGFIVEHFEGDEEAVFRLLVERGLAPEPAVPGARPVLNARRRDEDRQPALARS